MRHNTFYTIIFAALICVVCGVFVSYAAVSLNERQVFNAALDKKTKVLEAAGLVEADESVTAERVEELFANIESVAVELETGNELADFDLEGYDQLKAAADPDRSVAAPENASAIKTLPKVAEVFKMKGSDGGLEMLILPIEGLGLWGTLYGFLAIDGDLTTVRGITYYTHKETPGLGGEVDNPRWKALWPGRRVFDDDGAVALEVIKGQAPPAADAPYQVDGLSGATITARGVSNMIDFWMGDRGFGKFLDKLRA